MELGMFAFERLDAYRVAREALVLGVGCRERLAGLPGEVRSQMERALVSMVANIAEGAGRASRADRRRHYAIARGSANEAGAALEIARLYVELPEHPAMRTKLIRVVRMLNVMLSG